MPCNAGHDWCRGHEIVHTEGGIEFCVFHAPKENKGRSGEEFNELVFAEINRARRENRACNLSGTIFPDNISFRNYNEKNPLPEISFFGAKFSGKADFSLARFNGKAKFSVAKFSVVAKFTKALFNNAAGFSEAQFIGDAKFTKALFNDAADFSEAQFKSKAIFSVTQFSGMANFYGAPFSDEAKFVGAQFGNVTNFNGASFSGEANFSEVLFSDRASFSNAQFNGKADFFHAQFSGWANFYLARLSDKADFFYTRFSSEADFIGTRFSDMADFSNAEFNKALFRNANFEGRAVFSYVDITGRLSFQNLRLLKPSFLGTDLEKCDFIACGWNERNGRYVLHDEEELRQEEVDALKKSGLLKAAWKKCFSPLDEGRIRQVEAIYRTLKQKAKLKHNEFDYSHWHYSEKEMQRKRTGVRNSFNWLTLNFYNIFSGYGERPVRALLALILLFVLFAFLLSCLGLEPMETVVSSLSCDNKTTESIKISNMDKEKFQDLFISTLQYITFQRTFCYLPETQLGEVVRIFFQIVIYIQATLFAFALRNRFRR
jgi:hypothetical protein